MLTTDAKGGSSLLRSKGRILVIRALVVRVTRCLGARWLVRFDGSPVGSKEVGKEVARPFTRGFRPVMMSAGLDSVQQAHQGLFGHAEWKREERNGNASEPTIEPLLHPTDS